MQNPVNSCFKTVVNLSEKKGLFSFLNFESIVENFSGYIEKRIALFKMEFFEDLALGSARLIIFLVLSICVFMIILFLSIAGAFVLNSLLNSHSLGFVLVAAFYVIVFIILSFAMNKKVEGKLKDAFLEMLNSLEEKDEDD